MHVPEVCVWDTSPCSRVLQWTYCPCLNLLQEFLQRVAVHEPKVLSFERLQLKGHDQPPVVLEASAIKAEHQLLGEQWEKLQQEKLAWGKLLDCCEAAWERCITTEGGLRSLEEEHAKWELPAENKDILVQLKEMEVRT